MTPVPLNADPDDDRFLHVHRLWPHPDGRTLAAFLGTEEWAYELLVWDLAAGQVVGRHRLITDTEHGTCHPLPVLSPDHRFAAYGGRLRELATGTEVELPHSPWPHVPPATPPRASWLGRLIAGFNPTRAAARLLPPDSWEAAFAPDGRTLFAAPNQDRHQPTWVDRWTPEGERAGPPLVADGPNEGPLTLAATPGGEWLAGADHRGRLFRWYLPAGERLPSQPTRADWAGRRVWFSPCGRTLAVADPEGVRLYDPAGTAPRAVLPVAAADLAFTPDGGRLLTAGVDVTVWDTVAGRELERYDFRPLVEELTAVAVAPDGLTAFAAGYHGPVVRWDL